MGCDSSIIDEHGQQWFCQFDKGHSKFHRRDEESKSFLWENCGQCSPLISSAPCSARMFKGCFCTRGIGHQGEHFACTVHGAREMLGHTQFADASHTREKMIGLYLEQVKNELELAGTPDYIRGLVERIIELREKQ